MFRITNHLSVSGKERVNEKRVTMTLGPFGVSVQVHRILCPQGSKRCTVTVDESIGTNQYLDLRTRRGKRKSFRLEGEREILVFRRGKMRS